jgi:hypothetical protein
MVSGIEKSALVVTPSGAYIAGLLPTVCGQPAIAEFPVTRDP